MFNLRVLLISFMLPIYIASINQVQEKKSLKAYPNPFNNVIKIIIIGFDPKNVSIKVYNIQGKEVKKLKGKQIQSSSYSEAEWDGTNNNGVIVGSGMYLIHFRARVAKDELYKKTFKVIFLK